MCVRLDEVDEDSEQELGIFMALERLLRDGAIEEQERGHCEEIRQWFRENLKEPPWRTLSGGPDTQDRAPIFWFKESAREHITHAEAIAAILRRHGVSVEKRREDCAGRIVYQDAYQIAAVPLGNEA